MLKRLLDAGQYIRYHLTDDCGPLLRAVRRTNQKGLQVLQQITAPLTQPIVPLSYSTTRLHAKLLVRRAGIKKDIGLHSMRIGGTTAAIASNCDDRLVCILGRWKSKAVMDERYVRIFREHTSQMFELTRKFWN